MMLHVRESLDLQQRLMAPFAKAEDRMKHIGAAIERYHLYKERLTELENLGETGYLIAHSKDDEHIRAIVDSLDSGFGGPMLSQMLRSSNVYAERQKGIEMVSIILAGWDETLQRLEHVLSKRERDILDDEQHSIGDMCAAARKGSDTAQRWLASISGKITHGPHAVGGLLETERMLVILRDLDNTIVESNTRFIRKSAPIQN